MSELGPRHCHYAEFSLCYSSAPLAVCNSPGLVCLCFFFVTTFAVV